MLNDRDLIRFIENSVEIITKRLNLPSIHIEIDEYYQKSKIEKNATKIALILLKERKVI